MSIIQAMLAALGGGGAIKNYVDDVFSAYTYTGNSTVQTINNGIDLAGRGGLVWIKCRGDGSRAHRLFDTARGVSGSLSTNDTAPVASIANMVTGYNGNGFTLGADATFAEVNSSGFKVTSWTFRKAPKFFDVVTYTAAGGDQSIPHNLGVAPAMMLVKCTSAAGSWWVYHASLGPTGYARFETTSASGTASLWQNTTPTASQFFIGSASAVANPGATYVAYLFAHDTSVDGIIQCGTFTTDGVGDASVNLGWEPQFLLAKAANGTGGWNLIDTARGWTSDMGWQYLGANSDGAESASGANYRLNASGFSCVGNTAGLNWIYMAIRRPNKSPTLGTQVYNAIARTGTGAETTVTGVGFAPDMLFSKARNDGSYSPAVYDRLRGAGLRLQTSSTATADIADATTVTGLDVMDGFRVGAESLAITNATGGFNYIHHFFKRAPGFLDVVSYSGTGAVRTVPHSLGVAPELMIIRMRNAGNSWAVYTKPTGATKRLLLQNTTAATADTYWNDTDPTASVFTVGAVGAVGSSSSTYIAYLFGSLAGISKVFSYTGNGTSQAIDCGFSNGARFILIKRTNTTGDWFIWDTVRGIVAGNDPHISFNLTTSEVINNDTIDPASSGFIVNQLVATNLNINAATYIGLAIA